MQKYKVFLNGKGILFGPSAMITITKPSLTAPNFTGKKQVQEWLDLFSESTESGAFFDTNDPDAVFLNFRRALINIDAAGGVVKRNGSVLFILRNGKWDLPKGKIDNEETPVNAALREVEEECGIRDLRVVKELSATYHLYRSPYHANQGKWIFKQTFWYEMEYSGEGDGLPQAEEGITELRWFKPGELDEVLANTYENLKQLIELYRD